LLRSALANSYNIPAVELMNRVGTIPVIDTAHAMGIESITGANYGLSVALGGAEVKLIDMVFAFSVFANGGTMLGEAKPPEDVEPGYRQLDPVSILQVTTATAEELYRYEVPQRREVLSPQVAYLINDILSDNAARTPAFGSANALTLPDRPVAAKTGTTNDFHDGWAVGYTPQYVTGIWTGNANHEPMGDGAAGARTAAPLWQKIMIYLHEGKPVERFARPEGLVTATIDAVSGSLATEKSRSTREEIFIAGTVPTLKDEMTITMEIDITTGQAATPYCPREFVEARTFTIYPPEASEWVQEQGIPQPPTEQCSAHGPSHSDVDVSITSPRPFQTVGGVVTVTGNARAGSQERYWLQIGAGAQPSQWTPIMGESGDRIENGVLGVWHTGGMDGSYQLQLVVVDAGQPRTITIPVHVDNQPPTVTLNTTSRTFQMGVDEAVIVEVRAADNAAVSRVELYLNGQQVGSTTEAPYTVRVPYEAVPGAGDGPGTRTYAAYVVVYDTAGNSATSGSIELTVVTQ
jgi:membrane carboxypeptidase/penicillin-binding protein PbpC